MASRAWAFFKDLRRRRVYRTAALYAVIAWGLTEVLTTIFEKLFFPDWASTLLVISLLVGFPITMYLAWVFDITPEGIRRTRPTSMKGWLAMTLSLLLMVGGTAGLFWVIYPGESEPQVVAQTPVVTELPDNTIAVLPFTNASEDEGFVYFAEGVAETLLGQLSMVKELRVIARDSSFQLRGSEMAATVKARRLNAGFLLDGSVQRVGDAVRVIARLINGTTGEYIWSETFDGATADVFNIQDAISDAVIAAVRPRLQQANGARPVHQTTRNAEAYDQYLLGLYSFNKRDPESLEIARDYFGKAIELDPDFALAYVGRANTHSILSGWGIGGQSYEGTAPIRTDATDYNRPTQAKQAAEDLSAKIGDDVRRALELAPDLAEAHAASGLLLMIQQDYAGAAAAMLYSIELNPSYAFAHHMYGLFLREVNRFDESLAELRTALSLDSLSYTLRLDLAQALKYAGDNDSAIEQYELLIEAEPDRPAAYRELYLCYRAAGLPVDATRINISIERLGVGVGLVPLGYRFLELRAMAGSMEFLNATVQLLHSLPEDYPRYVSGISESAILIDDPRWALDKAVEVIARSDHATLSTRGFVSTARLAILFGEYQMALDYLEIAGSRLDDLNWPHGFFYIENNMPYVDAITLAMAHRGLGDEAQAVRLITGAIAWLDELERNGFRRPAIWAAMGKAYALLGEMDRAFEYLNRYADHPSANAFYLLNDGALHPLVDFWALAQDDAIDLPGADPRLVAVLERTDARITKKAQLAEINQLIAEYEALTQDSDTAKE